jgi:hypothetical protein
MKYLAVLEANEWRSLFGLELKLSLSEVGGGEVLVAICQFRGSTAGPRIVLE